MPPLFPLSLRERARVRVAGGGLILDGRGVAGALTLPSPGARGLLSRCGLDE
jgi:hypothetical protein